MNTSMSRRLAWLLLTGLLLAELLLAGLLPLVGGVARAQSTAPGAAPDAPSNVETAPADAPGRLDEWRDEINGRHHRHRQNLVNIGRDSDLPRGQRADSVVSILGSSSSEGEAREVVSVLGNTRVTGPLSRSAVAVLGNTYVDAKVDGDVVAVMGNVELGPSAEIGGDVVARRRAGWSAIPPPSFAASVQRIIDIDVGGASGFGWLRTWIDRCLLLRTAARPLLRDSAGPGRWLSAYWCFTPALH